LSLCNNRFVEFFCGGATRDTLQGGNVSNAVVFMADEHNPFYSSVYGHPSLDTPNLQRLAQSGSTYANAYTPCPLCMPSRSAFLTGKRVHEISVFSNCTAHLDTNHLTLGKVFVDQGVHGVNIGTLHAFDRPENLGFSELLFPHAPAPPGDCNHGRTPLMIRHNAANRANSFGPRDDAFVRDRTSIEAASAWLTRRAPQMDRPWCLVINLSKPHFPLFAEPEYWRRVENLIDLPHSGIECESAQHPYAQDLRAHFQTEQFTIDQVRGLRQGYFACVSFADEQLGRIMDTLAETGLARTTNLFYTSDHGEMLGKFGMWWKCHGYEDAVRIPMIAAGPDFPSATRVSTPVDLLDLQATLFRVLGATRPYDWRGTPLTELPAHDPDRVIFSEYHGHGTRSGLFVIRKGDWKLIYYMAGPHQLFDLAHDPQERVNRYKAEPEKAKALERELHRICDPVAVNQRAHQLEREQLASLGLLNGTTARPDVDN
jgi:choline-sulfatase